MDWVDKETTGVSRSTCFVDPVTGRLSFWLYGNDDIRPDDGTWVDELKRRLRGSSKKALVIDLEASALYRPSARIDFAQRLADALREMFPVAVVCVERHTVNRAADMMTIVWSVSGKNQTKIPCDVGRELTRTEVDFVNLAFGGK